MAKRRRFTSAFKKKVVLAVLRGDRTIQDLAAHYEVHPNMISTWKRQAIEGMDELFMLYPFYGSRQLMRHLQREGFDVGRHRVRRLMRLMRLKAIYRKPKAQGLTSDPHPEHRIYPYLLRGLTITRANHVWCTDITFIPMRRGFLYLVAIIGQNIIWATRHVLSWRLSNSMDTSFCIWPCAMPLKSDNATKNLETGHEPVRCPVSRPLSIFNILKMEINPKWSLTRNIGYYRYM